MLAVAALALLRETASSTPTLTESAAPTSCPASSHQKILTAIPATWPAPSLSLGLPMLSIHMGATLASAMDTTSPMTLSTPAPGAKSPFINYSTEWEIAHVHLTAMYGRPLETARQS